MRTERDAQARHFGEAAGDERGARVETELQAVGDPGRDREHVLHRAADFDADRIARGVDAQAVAVQRRDGFVAQGRVGARRDQRGGPAARDLDRKARP